MGALIRAPKLETRPRILSRPGNTQDAEAPISFPSEEPVSIDDLVVDEPVTPTFEERLAEVETKIETRFAAKLTEARNSVEGAQKELEAMRETITEEREAARESGFSAGHAEGLEAGGLEVHELIERAGAIIESLNHATGERLQREEDAVAEAVMAGICKILGNAFATRDGIVASVKNVCSEIHANDVLSVHLAPDDHALFSDDETFSASLGEGVQIVSDSKIELGGCLVEWSGGSLDGRLELQIERLRTTLRSARQNLDVEVV